MNLSADPSFDFNLLRWVGTAPYLGADVAEVLDLAGRLAAGDFESWYAEFFSLAERVAGEGWPDRPASPVTRRDRAFRAAAYYRAADFYLHGNPPIHGSRRPGRRPRSTSTGRSPNSYRPASGSPSMPTASVFPRSFTGPAVSAPRARRC